MRAQRVREGESRMEMQAAKWTAEGAVNSHYFESAQYSATWGIRQLPGICRYSAKRTVQTVKQGGSCLPETFAAGQKNKGKDSNRKDLQEVPECIQH